MAFCFPESFQGGARSITTSRPGRTLVSGLVSSAQCTSKLGRQAGRAACPSVVIMDGQSVKTIERGGVRGFDAHKRVKRRKRNILVDTFRLLIACRVEPAGISDRKAAALLLGGLRPHHLLRQDGWKLQIVKRQQRAFKITGLTWIVERSFAWLGRNRAIKQRLRVQRAEL
jgi:putative transposase